MTHRDVVRAYKRIADQPFNRVQAGTEHPFDILLFREGRADVHAALVVRKGLMLHIRYQGTTHLTDYHTGEFAYRLDGVYRVDGLMDAGFHYA